MHWVFVSFGECASRQKGACNHITHTATLRIEGLRTPATLGCMCALCTPRVASESEFWLPEWRTRVARCRSGADIDLPSFRYQRVRRLACWQTRCGRRCPLVSRSSSPAMNQSEMVFLPIHECARRVGVRFRQDQGLSITPAVAQSLYCAFSRHGCFGSATLHRGHTARRRVVAGVDRRIIAARRAGQRRAPACWAMPRYARGHAEYPLLDFCRGRVVGADGVTTEELDGLSSIPRLRARICAFFRALGHDRVQFPFGAPVPSMWRICAVYGGGSAKAGARCWLPISALKVRVLADRGLPRSWAYSVWCERRQRDSSLDRRFSSAFQARFSGTAS